MTLEELARRFDDGIASLEVIAGSLERIEDLLAALLTLWGQADDSGDK